MTFAVLHAWTRQRLGELHGMRGWREARETARREFGALALVLCLPLIGAADDDANRDDGSGAFGALLGR